jgi:hypothetical protein
MQKFKNLGEVWMYQITTTEKKNWKNKKYV